MVNLCYGSRVFLMFLRKTLVRSMDILVEHCPSTTANNPLMVDNLSRRSAFFKLF